MINWYKDGMVACVLYISVLTPQRSRRVVSDSSSSLTPFCSPQLQIPLGALPNLCIEYRIPDGSVDSVEGIEQDLRTVSAHNAH